MPSPDNTNFKMHNVEELNISPLLLPWIKNIDKYAKNLAIETEDESISHQELYESAIGMQKIIKKQKIQSSAFPVIAIAGDKSISTVRAMLSGLLSGYAFSYIEEDSPQLAIPELLKLLNPAALIRINGDTAYSENNFRECASQLGIPWIDINKDTMQECSSISYINYNHSESSYESIAYVMFSSGSTGIPKGICISHSAAAAAISAYIRDLCISSEDIIGASVSLSFDVSMFDLFSSLSTGAKLRLIRSDKALTLKQRGEKIAQSGASVIFTVPGLADAMVNAESWNSYESNLRILALTGERFSSDFLKSLYKQAS